MEKIRLITDSASDISFEDEKTYDIRILPFQVVLGENSYVSRVDFDNDGFYQLMEKYDEIPKTSQITPFSFQEIYLEEAKAGYTDLILVMINSKGSATCGNAVMAKDLFFDEHPEYQGKVNITVYDGKGYSAMYGSPLVAAGRMRNDGKSAQEIRAYLEETLEKQQIYFGMYSLKYAGKSGRIPSAAAFIGDKLNLKPVMKIFDGEISTAAKVRGEAKLINKIAAMSLKDMEPGTPYQIIYGSDSSCKDEITAIMTEKTGYAPDACYQIGAAIAANAGPKVVGVAFTVKKD
ncbi:MAG: DegV family protein [Lachnospiraceae bacterium]|nr:DegV family protein [Lachnospiraceae bacterium]